MYSCSFQEYSFWTNRYLILRNLRIFTYFDEITDLYSLIGNSQYGNFRIYLPLEFYVKSVLVILKPQKVPFLANWAGLKFGFLETVCRHFQVWNFSKHQNSNPPKLLKRQFLTFRNQLKLISRKIRLAGKLLNFHTVEYP